MAGGGSIQQQVAAILAGQQAPVNLAFRQAGAQATAQQAKINSERLALVRLLQSGVGPAGRAYNQGIAQQQALAHSAAAGLAASSPDPQMQENLRAIGAPASQQAALGAQNRRDFAGQGAVLYTGQGAIPGASLVAQKSAAQQYLAGLPTVAALGGEQTLRGLGAQQAKVRDAYLQEVVRIQGQAPALIQNAEATQAANAARQASLQAENAYRAAELQQGQQRIGISQQRANQSAAAARAAAAQKQAAAAQKKAKGAADAGKTRQAEFWSTRAKALRQAASLYKTQVPNATQPAGAGATTTTIGGKTGAGILATTTTATAKHQRYSRGGAYNVLWSTYAPQLISAGFKPATVQLMIDRALHTAGYPLPDRTPGAGPTRNRASGRRRGGRGRTPNAYPGMAGSTPLNPLGT